MVHRRDLDDDGQVPPGLHRDGGGRDFDAQDLDVFALHPHPVIDLVLVPLLQLDNHIQLFRLLDGAHTKYSARIDDAYTAQFQKVADVLR